MMKLTNFWKFAALAGALALSAPAIPVFAQEAERPERDGDGDEREHGDGDEREHGDGDEREHGDGAGEEGEEGGTVIRIDETWDALRRGARLVLRFVPATGAFVGTVENTTQLTMCAVRVEVHLSEGIELGPTERADLPPGETVDVQLFAFGEVFEAWTAHPEMSNCEGG
jgi:hypothetical protein